MDQQHSSHALMNSNFVQTAANLQNQLAAGLNNANGNVDNNQLLSRLHQLSSFNAASSLLQPSFGNHLTNDFYNPSNAAWQAKVAAMIPVYNSVLGDTQQFESIMEQSLKASGFNLGTASQQSNALGNGVNTFPIIADLSRLAANNSIPNMSNHFFPVQNNQLNLQPDPHMLMSQERNGTPGMMMPSTSNPYNGASSSTSTLSLNVDTPKMNNQPFFTSPTNFSMPKHQSFNMGNQQNSADSFNMSAMISLAQQAKLTSPTKYSNLPMMGGQGTSLISPTLSYLLPTTTMNNQMDRSHHFDDDLSELDPFNPHPHSMQHHQNNDQNNFGNNILPVTTMNSSHQSMSLSIPTTSSHHLQTPVKNNVLNTSREIDNDKEVDQWFPMDLLPDENPNSPEQTDLFGGETTGFCLDPIMFTPPDSPNTDIKKMPEKRFIPQQEPVLQQQIQHVQQQLSSSLIPSNSRTRIMPTTPVHPRNDAIPRLASVRLNQPQPPTTASVSIPNDGIVFIPKSQRTSVNERIPVYKRKSANLPPGTTLEKALEKVSKPKVADEFSFTDEEDELPAKPLFAPIFDDFDDNIDAPNSPSVAEAPEQQQKRKPHVEEKETARKEEKLVNEPFTNGLSQVIQSRRAAANKLDSVFIHSEIISDDENSFVPAKQPPLLIVKPVNYLAANNVAATPSTSKTGENEREQIKLRLKLEPKSPEVQAAPIIADFSEVKKELEVVRVIPKLVIKLPKRESTTIPSPEPVHKKKKKKHKKHRDNEYLPSEEKRKKKKKKHRSRERERSNEMECIPAVVPERRPESVLPIPPIIISSNGCSTSSQNVNDRTMIEKRLSCFKQASGSLAKGTFVISKQDIFKADCALWKVDNQNLLQKYPQFVEYAGGCKVIRYKNSSTYSGWCDQVAASYLVVQCKYLKHTRAESIVEPEIPIADLIPATCEVVSPGEGNDALGLDDEPAADDIFEPVSSMLMTKNVIRSHMRCFTQAMLKHAATMDFLQTVKACNDWEYLVVMNEIDTLIDTCKLKINEKVRWGQHFEVVLSVYPNMSAADSDIIEDGDICQACGDDFAFKSVQLYSNEGYNYENLTSVELPELDGQEPHPAIEFDVCLSCSHLSLLYHRIHHMKFNVFRICEDLLERVSSSRPELSTDAIIMICMNKRSWQRKLINDYAKLWKKIQEKDF